MTRGDSDASFKRRKFTITESLDNVLEELAEQNYQGNVSLCLRVAIEDHRETLNGTDTGLITQQLLQRIEELSSRQDQIDDALKSLERELAQKMAENGTPSFPVNGVSDDAQRILVALEDEATGLRINDLAERLDLPTARIQPALGTLVDRGIITPNGESPTRYQLPGIVEHESQGF